MGGYEGYSDEELIAMMKRGEPEIMDYLMEKYKNLVRRKARALYLIGGDGDDLIQEGMIGLLRQCATIMQKKKPPLEALLICVFHARCIRR